MFNKKTICLILAALFFASVVPLSGCGKKTPDSTDVNAATASPTAEAAPAAEETPGPTAVPTAEPTPFIPASEPPTATPEPEIKYEFNPHLYLPILASDIPQEYWDAFYNLCDALRAGETTFECASEEAYRWATDPTTLTELFPPACVKIKGQSSDGTAPYENGVGRIFYQMPIDEYVERQARFEALVEDVLNTWLEPDDDDFEKCLKLYNYMESSYTYDWEFHETLPDGANYDTIMKGKGQCIELSSVYAYFLLQAGVEAMQVGCTVPTMAHSWTYIVIDGKGYHSDPTWSLKSTVGHDDLALYYFMMTDERRSGSGCPVDDLEAPLLPRYWAKFSSVEFIADDARYSFPSASFLLFIDEENKTVHYITDGTEYVLGYCDP